MRENVTGPRGICAARRDLLRRALLLAVTTGAAIGVLPTDAAAQAVPTHTENAVPVPRGMVRLRIAPSWARWNSFFSDTGTAPLGSVLTSPALGAAQIPALGLAESALRAVTGDQAARLSLGASRSVITSRVVTTPYSLEYGATNRLSVGVTVPVVQRQREMFIDVHDSTANVGRTSANPAVQQRAAQLASQLESAASQLGTRIQQCSAQPAGANCGPITADPAGAMAAAQTAVQVALGLRILYGTAPDEPSTFGLSPRASLEATITQRLEALGTQLARYLGTSPITDPTAPAGAASGLATGELRDLAFANGFGVGPDSLGRLSRIGIGDIELGARYVLFDTRAAERARRDSSLLAGGSVRVTLGALVRLGTGTPAVEDQLFFPGTGDGQTDVEASLATDWEGGSRLGATVFARYVAQLGSVDATRVPDDRGVLSPFGATGVGSRTLGDVITLDVSPRYRLGNSFFISGHYGFIRRADDQYTFPQSGVDDAPLLGGAPRLPQEATVGGFTEQRAGVGLLYSTVADYEAGRIRVPIEVSYTWLATIAGADGMVPRASRDQIALRFYYRLRR